MSRTITPTIVVVEATVTVAPAPSVYQQSGALVSVGGTTLTENTYQYCSSLSAVQALLSVTGNYVEVGNMATSFFAQQSITGATIGVYVLELGTQGSGSAAITALDNWDTANPSVFYSYLIPATWDAEGSQLNTWAETFASPSGKKYVFPTTTEATISAYANTKSLITTVPSPTAASTEFQAAGAFYQWLVNNPSAGTPVPPMGFRYLYGFTPWPTVNNGTTIQEILTAYGNIVLTGAEGGITNSCLFEGTTMDGQQAGFWYAADWLQIQAKLQLANAIINASNSLNPIYYNQAGINRLLTIIQDICNDGISYGLFLSAVPAAIPFATYVAANPGQYDEGIYNGFSCQATPQTGFLQIQFSVNFSSFAAAAA
jgi:hypothetical protein